MSESSNIEKLLYEYRLFVFGIAAGLIVSLEISVFWSRLLESGSQFLNQTLISRNPQATSTSVTTTLFVIGAFVMIVTVPVLGWLARRLLGIPDWAQMYSTEHKEELDALSARIIRLLEDDFCKGTNLAPPGREHEKNQDVIYVASTSAESLTKLVVTKDTITFFAWRSQKGVALTGRIFEFLRTRVGKDMGATPTAKNARKRR